MTKTELYKMDRLRKAVLNQEYIVDGNVYIGNPGGNVTFLRPVDVSNFVDKNRKINGQTLEQDIYINTFADDDSSNYNTGEYVAGAAIGSPIVVALIGGLIYPFDITDETHYGKAIGVSLVTGAIGDTVIVALGGEVETGTIMFTAGNAYYIGATSYLTDTPPTNGILQLIAVAKTTSIIVIEIQQPIIQT